MDVVETGDGTTMPVDFKRGKRPHVAAGACEPERVQVCVQAMILEDNGHRVEQGDSRVVLCPGLIEAPGRCVTRRAVVVTPMRLSAPGGSRAIGVPLRPRKETPDYESCRFVRAWHTPGR